jgi:hypothetical protein
MPAPSTSSGLSKGAIAGITLGGIVALALLSALFFDICIRPKLAKIDKSSAPVDSAAITTRAHHS